MPRFEPFRGVRYDPDLVDLAQVTAPPYDVIDDAGRQVLADRHPANVVAIDLPVTAGTPTAGPAGVADDDADYREARHQLDGWLAEGTLRRDSPSFYVYRMATDGPQGPHRTTGVLGALELSRPGEGGILPHEHTTPKAKSDRLRLMQATQANLSAVWGLSPAPGLSALLEMDQSPLASWEDDGVTHTLWRVEDPGRVAAIARAVADHPVVIADGHHRYETSLTYRDEQRALGADGAPGAEAVLTFIVELVDDELDVAPIHRLVRGLPEGFDLPGALTGWFEVAELDPELLDAPRTDPDPTGRLVDLGALGLVTPKGVWSLIPRPERFVGVRDLDTSRLDVALAELPDHELTFQHGVDQVMARVHRGEFQAGFLLRPATVAQIVEIARGGERMPPKTTFFAPEAAHRRGASTPRRVTAPRLSANWASLRPDSGRKDAQFAGLGGSTASPRSRWRPSATARAGRPGLWTPGPRPAVG